MEPSAPSTLLSPLPDPRPPVDVASLVHRTSELLRAHVPLTLLLDLASEDGPHSAARYGVETADTDWLRVLQD